MNGVALSEVRNQLMLALHRAATCYKTTTCTYSVLLLTVLRFSVLIGLAVLGKYYDKGEGVSHFWLRPIQGMTDVSIMPENNQSSGRQGAEQHQG